MSKPAPATSPALDTIEHALRVLFQLARSPRFGDGVRTRAGVDLDRASYGVLMRIGQFQPLRLSELALHVGVDVSTVSRQVRTLDERGLVERRRDVDDGRAMQLVLSADGRALAAKVKAAWDATIADLMSEWSTDDVETFAGLLDGFVVRLGAAQ